VTTHERERVAALHEYRLLDSPAGDELEAVVRVAALVAGVPTATLNLIDENRQCQLTTTGFTGGDSPREASMCAVHFEKGDFVYRPDARLDPVFRDNPWVTGRLAGVRFYASAPLITPQGYALGSLCVFDDRPGELTGEQIDRLKDLAAVILALFERRRQARANGELAAELRTRNGQLESAQADRAATIAELRRSNTELQQFAGVVSHDLAAPLGVVNGYLELLGEQGADEESARWIGAAARAVDRMSRLITSLLDYASAGHAPCRTEPAALGDLVEQALTDLHEVVHGATVTVAPGLPVVDCDPTLVRQLLQNLIGNALKYRHPDRPCRIEVCAERAGPDGRWAVTVADNGLGIPAEQRARVFEMFAQVDPAAGTGHGIGLSTCHRIVERHGGRIEARETPGGGTTMTFTLPATSTAPAGVPAGRP
jgi:signal transduction histidine kinase